jgi:hypothetical protein
MNIVWPILKGIFLAQLGVPVYVLMVSVFSGELDAAKLIATSLFGFLFSVPCSLIIGVPVSMWLYRINKLKPTYIMAFSPLTLVPVVLYVGGTNVILLMGPAVLVGAILFSIYVSRSSALTSQSTRTW